jgi:hypothetical protein
MPTSSPTPTSSPPSVSPPMRSSKQGHILVVTRGGSLRSEPRLALDTTIAYVCPGDEVQVLAEQQENQRTWLHIRVLAPSSDCATTHAMTNAEGWVDESVVME